MEDFLKRIVALLVYVGAFAAIPFIAKRLSGALGGLTGKINDRSKGLIDRPHNQLKRIAQERRQGRRQALGNRWFGKAMAQEKPSTLNPLKKEPWRARKRLRAETVSAWRHWRTGGVRPEMSQFKKDEEEGRAQEADPERIGQGSDWPSSPREALTRAQAGRAKFKQYRQQRREEIKILVGQTVGMTMSEEFKTNLGQAETAIFEKDLLELEDVVLDTKETAIIRQAAANKLVKSGMVKPLRKIIKRAYGISLTSPNDVLVNVVKNLKNSNELYSAFKDSAPDIAKSAFDDQNKIAATAQARFLVTSSIENSTLWDVSTWETVINLPKTNPSYTETIKIGDVERRMNARQIRNYILENQGRGILSSPQAKRKAKQDVIELIKNGLGDGKPETTNQPQEAEEEN